MLLTEVAIQKSLIFNKKIKDDPLDTKGIIIVLYKNNIIERLCVHTVYEQQSVNTRRKSRTFKRRQWTSSGIENEEVEGFANTFMQS